MSLARPLDLKSIYKNYLYLCILAMSVPKMKLRKQFIHSSIKNSKMLKSKFNIAYIRPVHWKLQNIAKKN